ncbi:MAG: hypothetical protein C5B50_21925, partial [Verrucomicrobia bacterium]
MMPLFRSSCSSLAAFLILSAAFCEAASVPSISIGLNFTGSVNSTYSSGPVAGLPETPPDPDGFIGPAHFVEFVNGW